jgi:hypothetical protein
MQTICCSIATLAVATIYYSWRSYLVEALAHERTLRDRVAYLLWVMADGAE